jgi:hypothetical protein
MHADVSALGWMKKKDVGTKRRRDREGEGIW